VTLRLFDPRRALALLAALCLSVLTGFAFAESPVVVSGGLVSVLLFAVILRHPEVGALISLILVAIVPRDVLFERGLSLGEGNLKVTDLLLIATLACWLAARTVDPERYPLPSGWTTILILGFLLFAAVSLATAQAIGTPQKLSLLELRPLLSYLLVFPLVSGARSWRHLRAGILLLLAAAMISAGISVVEYVRGVGSGATFADGALRVDSATLLMPLVAAVSALALLAYAPTRRLRLATLFLAGVVLTGLFFTFSRGAWIALISGGLVIIVLLRPRLRVRVVGWLIPLIVVAAASVTIFNMLSPRQVANPLSAGLERLTSAAQYDDDVSGRYRLAEWGTAIEQIKKHPLTGIGLGSSITFANPMFSPTSNSYGFIFSTFYIHNSYIWFALKIGLIGACLFFSLMTRVCSIALAGYRRANDPREQMVQLAALGSLFAVLVLSITGPHLSVDNATPAVAALIAGVEIARRLGGQEAL